ncbi:MAG: hypothetical protein LC790_02135 [Actinobacteria bacterium]|nr:hypothetical protein [Actinomycetota bacterium]
MTRPAPARRGERPGGWVGALCDRAYDRGSELSGAEREALAAFVARGRGGRPSREVAACLARLTEPIEDVLGFVAPRSKWWGRLPARSALLGAIDAEQEAFWGWEREQWIGALERADPDVRQLVMAVAYLLCGQRELHRAIRGFKRGLFARRVFGAAAVQSSLARVQRHLDSFGYAATLGRPAMSAVLFELMLLAASPRLEDVAGQSDALVALHTHGRPALRHGAAQLAGALVEMRLLERSPLEAQSSSDEAWIARSSAPRRHQPARLAA